jgi:hypothetical protein
MFHKLFAGSGDNICIYDDYVYKGESTRIGKQAEYIEYLNRIGVRPHLPHILSKTDVSYRMEVLYDIDFYEEDCSDILQKAFYILKNHFWSKELGHQWLASCHYDLLDDFIQKQECAHLSTIFYNLPIWDLFQESTVIHGDPTLANCMRRDGRLVLIDPLPPEGKIPSTPYVDRAKLLQSYFGYEQMIFSNFPDINFDVYDLILSDLNTEERKIVIFFCVVHFLRVLPYRQKQTVLVEKIKYMIKTLIQMLKNV